MDQSERIGRCNSPGKNPGVVRGDADIPETLKWEISEYKSRVRRKTAGRSYTRALSVFSW